MRRRLPMRELIQASQPLLLPCRNPHRLALATQKPCSSHAQAVLSPCRSLLFVTPCFTRRGQYLPQVCGPILCPLVAACALLCEPTPNPAANRKRSQHACLHEHPNVSRDEHKTRADGRESGAKLSPLLTNAERDVFNTLSDKLPDEPSGADTLSNSVYLHVFTFCATMVSGWNDDAA
jgi:hypothetical protein